MARRRRASRSNPWLGTALAAWDIALDAPQVVAMRSARIARAGSRPSARDRREATRMVSEKSAAFFESWTAMGWEMLRQQQLALGRAAADWMRLAANPLAAVSARRMQACSARAVAAVAEKGLAPVRRRARANARRLRARATVHRRRK